MKKSFKTILPIFMALILVFSLSACSNGNNIASSASATEKSITLRIVPLDGQPSEKEYKTTATTLYELLNNEKIAEFSGEAPNNFVTAVNGITYDFNVDGSYWGLFIDGVYATSGVNEIVLKSGVKYELSGQK